MPAFLAAVPYILGAARIAVPIAARAGASAVGRGASTIIRNRKPLGSVATTSFMAHDGLDVTRRGLVTAGIDKLLQSGGSSGSGGKNRKSSSGRAKRNSRKSNVSTKPSKPRPNRRTG